jgi:hypothetical protein
MGGATGMAKLITLASWAYRIEPQSGFGIALLGVLWLLMKVRIF